MRGADAVRGARRLYHWSRSRQERRADARFRTRLRVDPQAPPLVLSPHWDDAVLDCWEILSGSGAVNVVNVFAGVPAAGTLAAWDELTGASDSAQRARERQAEDARALGLAPAPAGTALVLAGRSAVNAALLDAQYRRGAGVPAPEQIDLAVSSCAAAASRIHAPAAIGGHPDHLAVRRYARLLLEAGFEVSLYAELPYCVMHGWPPWVDGRPAEPLRDVEAFWRPFLEGLPELGPLRSAEVVRLDDARAAAKLEAMRCYETQLPALSYGGRGLLADPEIHRYEVRWTLRRVP